MPKNMAKNWKKSLNPSSPGPEIYDDPKEAGKQLQHPENFKRYARDILQLLPIRQGRLLDVGCGLGWLVKEAASVGFTASGVDPSQTLVSLGKKELGVNLTVTFPINQKFDVVVAKHVLEHITEADQFLGKISHVLKPGGYFLTACPNNYSLMHWIFRDRWYGLCPSQHVWQFTPKSLSALLVRNGFKIDKVIVNSLDYQPGGVKQIVFWFLINLANLFRVGDQVVIICRRC